MELKQVEAVDVINMKYFLVLLFPLGLVFGQNNYKRAVLDAVEVDMLMSVYSQEGDHAAVTGGIGTEKLSDISPSLLIQIPLSEDGVLTVDSGISKYSSASSSNVGPFDGSNGASPWIKSSGASQDDVLATTKLSYTHYSDNRNFIVSANGYVSKEYDYNSIGFGGGFSQLFNNKNTELGINANVFLDDWKLIYPVELRIIEGDVVGITSLFGDPITGGRYLSDFTSFSSTDRHSYSLSFSVSQTISKYVQAAIFFDVVQQEGLLSTPFQRVYFSDRADYFYGDASGINNYANPDNRNLFHLADDVERLPSSRTKLPWGMRIHAYLSETFSLRTFYRYFSDDWGIYSNTVQVELPVRLGTQFSITPTFRYYDQTAANYFKPYNQHLSSQSYYTSDYDLSSFTSHQFGIGLGYRDASTKLNFWKLGLKSIQIRIQQYDRSDGLKSFSTSTAFSFVIN